MKKAAKLFSLILVLALFAAMAMGSGSGGSGAVQAPSSVTSGGQDAASKPAGSASGGTAAVKDVSIEESVVFDRDGIRITAKSFDAKSGLKLLIENDGDKSVTVQVRDTSVNGYMIDTIMSAEVAPGKKVNETLTLSRTDLANAGITAAAEIEFRFHIFDSASWNTICDSDVIRIETSAAEGFAYSFDDSGNRVYNEKGVEIVVKGLSENGSLLGPEVVVYLYNSGSSDFTVQVRDVSINGYMVESIFSCDVVAGKHAVDTITFLSSDLEKNGIEKIENIELSFHVFDSDSWDTIVDTAPVTIRFD